MDIRLFPNVCCSDNATTNSHTHVIMLTCQYIGGGICSGRIAELRDGGIYHLSRYYPITLESGCTYLYSLRPCKRARHCFKTNRYVSCIVPKISSSSGMLIRHFLILIKTLA